LSKKQHHAESGRHRGQRRRHDAAARRHESDVYDERQPPWIRYSIYALAVILIGSLTVLFVGGFIRW